LIVGNDTIFDRRRKRTADRLLCNDGPDAVGLFVFDCLTSIALAFAAIRVRAAAERVG